MVKEIDPKQTKRTAAFDLWMHAPNPMVTFFKTLDVTPLVRLSRKRNLKFNMLLCWCIGKAATEVKEFYLLPVGEKLIQYDQIVTFYMPWTTAKSALKKLYQEVARR